MRAEWSGAMRCGHRVWLHPLARCGLAATVAIVRSNTGFANAGADKQVSANAAHIGRIIVTFQN